MTFEQQSQTELSMYNPELNDMKMTTQVSATKHKSSLKKRVQMMDPDMHEEEDDEEEEER